MGDPKKPKKKWEGPAHPWRKDVLAQELYLIGKYGLRNKRELWIARTMLRRWRMRARRLLALPPELREARAKPLISKLYHLGLLASEEASLSDILRLTVEDVLERRLQTIVYKKGLATSLYHARQLITHGHIAIGGRRVRSPGYMVSREEEGLIGFYPLSPLARSASGEVGAQV
ncbi:MAG: 30S ribosomal protein S4 [Thermofilaceae archaeon]